MVKVSVIVPVYDPGERLGACVDSLLAQTMPAGECELIFVDDGSTDGSAERLDALAAAHDHVHVRHIPNSGWPGRPRNLGLDIGRGEFVYFVDNDDWLDPEALERLYARALLDDADIVIGKVVGHGRRVPLDVFAANAHDLRAHDAPYGLLTPHKLFRRALLLESGVRFPEGHVRLEDHAMVVPAYFHARRIAVLADHPCYHWVRHGEGDANVSMRGADPYHYFDGVRGVLDLLERHTEPGDLRDRLAMRWYRGKLLQRVGGGMLLNPDAEQRSALFDAARAIALERFPERLDAALPYALRLRAALLRRGSLEGLCALAAFEDALAARSRVRSVRGDGTWLSLVMRGRLHAGDSPALVLRRAGDRVLWEAPAALSAHLDPGELDVTGQLADRESHAFLRSLDDGTQWPLRARIRGRLHDGEDGPAPSIVAGVRVAPTIAAAGAPLPAGDYELRLGVSIAGFGARTRVRRGGDGEPFVITVTRALRLEHWAPPRRRRAASGARRPGRAAARAS